MKIDKIIIEARITVNLFFFLSQKQNINEFPEIRRIIPALRATHLVVSVSYVACCFA